MNNHLHLLLLYFTTRVLSKQRKHTLFVIIIGRTIPQIVHKIIDESYGLQVGTVTFRALIAGITRYNLLNDYSISNFYLTNIMYI